MLHSPDNVCPLPTGLWQASPESSTFPYCHLSLYPHINKLWTTNGHCTETSKYWLQWNFANYFGPLFFMSFLLPSHCPAQSQGSAAVWAITWWLVILHLGSSLLKLWKISTTFFPSLDIAKPWPLSTAWHSSAMRLLTSLMSRNSQTSQIGGSLSLSRRWGVIPVHALPLCKSIVVAIYLWKRGTLDYRAMALG